MALEKEALLTSVRAAKGEVSTAEDELTKLVRELKVNLTGKETAIGEVLAVAFEKLRAARGYLVELEAAVAKDD